MLTVAINIMDCLTFTCLFSVCSLAPVFWLTRSKTTKKSKALNQRNNFLYSAVLALWKRHLTVQENTSRLYVYTIYIYQCQLDIIYKSNYKISNKTTSLKEVHVLILCTTSTANVAPNVHVKYFAPCCYSTKGGGPKWAASDGLVLWKILKLACWGERTAHMATPIMICDGSGCPSGCFGSRALVSVPDPSSEVGTPGGQKGMYRSQEEEDK